MMMKRLFILPLLFLVLSHVYAQKNIQGVATAELGRFNAMMGKDTIAIKRLIADDLIYVHSNGLTETKQDFVHSVATGKIQYDKIELEAHQIAQWRKTAAINGVIHVEGLVAGTPFNIRLRYLSLYMYNHGDWRLVRWQSTKI